jgi:Tfp pilus assembly protein PilN
MSHATYQVLVEREVLPSRRLLAILSFGALVIVLVAVIVLWELPRRASIETAGVTGAPLHIGTLQETLLADVHTTRDEQQRERAQLQRYEWVDKSHGVIAVPIDRAMDLLLDQNP